MTKAKVTILFALLFVFPAIAYSQTFYISPSGSDGYSSTQAKNESTPWKTFSKAFSSMSAGDELILLDGTYSEGNGTGYISYQGSGSGQIPSGSSKTAPTVVRAKNTGNVAIDGKLFIGRSTRKDRYIKIQGILFEGGGTLYNTSYVYLKDCGFHGQLGIGTIDHDNGNTYNLVEDCWIWADGARIIAANYRANNTVWRRVVIRGDGCSSDGCIGSGNPNVGITVYNSQNVSMQNVLVVDRVLGGGKPYGDFASAQHSISSGNSDIYLYNNQWIGCMSVGSEDTGFHFEADYAQSPSHYVKNALVMSSNNINEIGYNFNKDKGFIIENSSVIYTGGSPRWGVARWSDAVDKTTRSMLIKGSYSENAIYGGGATSYICASGSFGGGAYGSTTVSNGSLTNDGQSVLYPVRIEAGSALKGTGYNGSDYGANIVKRYGVDGTFSGDSGYNTLTNVNLWPWPNEALIRDDMRENSTRGFCASGQTLTKYIWEYLGNTIPSDVYSGNVGSGVTLVANAGPDVNQTLGTGDTSINVTLDGSASTGDISSYQWLDGGTVLSTERVATVAFTEGSRTVTLRVTDGSGNTDTDAMIVTVAGNDGTASNPPPTDGGSGTATTTTSVIGQSESWFYRKGNSDPGSDWNQISFDDSAWLTGMPGFGYGDGDDTTVLSDMMGNYMSVYLRKEFNNSFQAVQALTFSIDYDDGFIAYLNGTEIARKNMSGTPICTTAASGYREAGAYEDFDLSSYIGLLKSGKNVLAVEVHNSDIDSSDFSAIPKLSITGENGSASGVIVASPTNLRVVGSSNN